MKLFRAFFNPVDRDKALFRPPEDVATRRDSVDAAIEADKETYTPTRKAILGLCTLGLAGSSFLSSGVANFWMMGASSNSDREIEITHQQSWSRDADQFVGTVKQSQAEAPQVEQADQADPAAVQQEDSRED